MFPAFGSKFGFASKSEKRYFLDTPLNVSGIQPPELWAGVECTINRVGDEYFDQLERNGHKHRLSDLTLFAQLGIKALRYPLLWEQLAPDGLLDAAWDWADQRLACLQELGIRPIVGLLHHGSGPRSTNLLDPDFAPKFASYAQAVASRYPWLDSYIPVNEPLTTARFSGLYGHWYPHAHDPLSFATMLLNQLRAVMLAMRAIREINPAAQLIQNDDLGKTYSTPLLAYQADFENERRWLTFDLLAGKVNRQHSMWHYLRYIGITERDLEWFLENNCPPDIIGINHYITSERFLDERLEHYPAHTYGGNGRHTYADTEAVRVRAEDLSGPYGLLQETWQRYKLPLAFTEVHQGSSSDDQLRWFMEFREAAQTLNQTGADVRGVTAWSLLGSYDWDSLVTRQAGHYESGVFDVSSGSPQPTALAKLLTELGTGQQPNFSALQTQGWWHKPIRWKDGFAVASSGEIITI